MVLVRPSIVGRFLLLLVGIRPARTGLVEDLEEAAGEPRPEQCGLPSVGLESSQRHLLHHHHLPSGHGCPLAIDHRVGPDPSRWAPWTHRPFCAGGTRYCVFTDSSFQATTRP
ncbi:hypothetical protein VTK73DRAFT_5839 [Phialemonium thermophilum]|uniref:Secreted protein n=1 Tax=Phialemonium thermophilum TaxID=223376 RepID=A0ABR3V0J4_9PEZI